MSRTTMVLPILSRSVRAIRRCPAHWPDKPKCQQTGKETRILFLNSRAKVPSRVFRCPNQGARCSSMMSARVKVFGCRPFTDTCRRAETGPAFENLQGRKPRVGRAPIRRRELWGFERRRRLLMSGRNDRQRRFGRIERSEGVLRRPRDDFLAAALLGRGGWRMFRRAPAARSNDQREKRAELGHGG